MSTREELQVAMPLGVCPYCKRRYPLVKLQSGSTEMVQPMPVNPIIPVVTQADISGRIVDASGQPASQPGIPPEKMIKIMEEAVTGRRKCEPAPPQFVRHLDVCNRHAEKERKPRPDVLQDYDQRLQYLEKLRKYGQPGNTEGLN